jgi:hypothetical protein
MFEAGCCHPETEGLAAWALGVHDLAFGAARDLVLDASPTDVPRLLLPRGEALARAGRGDASVVAGVDGTTTLEELVDAAGLSTDELMASLHRLVLRGVLAI